MSMPSVDINLNIDVDLALVNIIASIALEEAALSHIINAEGEKIQHFLLKAGRDPDAPGNDDPPNAEELIEVNESVATSVMFANSIETDLIAKLYYVLGTYGKLPERFLIYVRKRRPGKNYVNGDYNNDNTVPLGGAIFRIEGKAHIPDPPTDPDLVDDQRRVDWESRAVSQIGTGNARIKLPWGEYELTETNAPDGYNGTSYVHEIVVDEDGTYHFSYAGVDGTDYYAELISVPAPTPANPDATVQVTQLNIINTPKIVP